MESQAQKVLECNVHEVLIRSLKTLNVESRFSAEVGDGESCPIGDGEIHLSGDIWLYVVTCPIVTIWRCY